MSRYKTQTGECKPVSLILRALVFTLAIFFSANPAAAEMLSEYHSINIDPAMRAKMDPDTIKAVLKFFQDAEKAIEGGDVDALMSLYSEDYKNGRHDKESAKRIWVRIFKKFQNTASIHNMRLESYSKGSSVVIITCSGLLLGKPKGGEGMITLDNWTDENHVIANENGSWKLLGTSGKEQKRFWFDKPMHPLF